MNTSLNDLDFDVNTLIPYDQFNWDCVDGIQCVIDDLNSLFERQATSIVKGVNDVDTRVQEILGTLQSHLVGSLNINEVLSSEMQRDIYSQVSSALAGLPQSGGMGTLPLRAWVVWRYNENNVYAPRIEVWDTPPLDLLSFGPYTCIPLLTCLMLQEPTLWSKAMLQSATQDVMRVELQVRYENSVGTDQWGKQYLPSDICLDYPIGEQWAEDNLTLSQWPCNLSTDTKAYKPTKVKEIPLVDPSETVEPTPISNPLNGPIPNGEYPQYPTTQLPESSGKSTTETDDMPMSPLPIPKLEDTTETTSETISGDCCRSIVAVLAQIRDRLAPQSSDDVKSDAKATAMGGIPDDQYLLSSQYETDIVAYWHREGYDTLANLPTDLVYNVRQITELFADDTPNTEEVKL